MRTLVWPILVGVLASAPNWVIASEPDSHVSGSTDDQLSESSAKRFRIPHFGLLNVPRDEQSSSRRMKMMLALDEALGAGVDFAIDKGRLDVRLDGRELPHRSGEAKLAVRKFAAVLDPEAAAEQQSRYGLFLPASFDQSRRLVLLIHGLNSGAGRWSDMAELLKEDGFQVAYFNYPNDQAISHSADRLTADLKQFHCKYPEATIDIVAHSLGSLVARSYVEGPEYVGGVDRFILLCPPNHGSRLTPLACLTEGYEHCILQQKDPNWSWTWAVSDGLGEGADEIRPHSEFLERLNDRPRRDGVTYTVVTGNRNSAQRYTADIVEATADHLPNRFGGALVEAAIDRATAKLRHRTGRSDGAVRVESALLEGVDDVVVLPADHTTIYCSRNGNPPVAWRTIRERLQN